MPGTPCTICPRPDRALIDEALISGLSAREVGRRFGVSKDSIGRHRSNHVAPLAASIDRVRRQRTVRRGEGPHRQMKIRDRLELLVQNGQEQLERALTSGASALALGWSREVHAQLMNLARLTGELIEVERHLHLQAIEPMKITLDFGEREPPEPRPALPPGPVTPETRSGSEIGPDGPISLAVPVAPQPVSQPESPAVLRAAADAEESVLLRRWNRRGDQPSEDAVLGDRPVLGDDETAGGGWRRVGPSAQERFSLDLGFGVGEGGEDGSA